MDPHQNAPLLHAGASLQDAQLVVILIHGRGATAEDILTLAPYLGTQRVAYLAPQAAGYQWYPYSFLAPLSANEPHLTSALACVQRAVEHGMDAGFAKERIVLAGFSQGACLASEFVARNPAPYGGLWAFSGGLLGAADLEGQSGPDAKSFTYAGSLPDMPVFIGCSNVDAHIPESRVRKTAEVFGGMGARVDLRIYPGMGHTINEDEMAAARGQLEALLAHP